MMEYGTAEGNWVFLLDSLDELKTLAAPEGGWLTDPGMYGGIAYMFRKGRSDLHNWKDVVEASDKEWAWGLERLEEMKEVLSHVTLPSIKQHKRRTRFREDDGNELDLDRLRSGTPYWRVAERESHESTPPISIFIDLATPGNRTSEEFIWRGVAALALAEKLEEAGYQTEIWGYSRIKFSYSSEKTFTTCFNFKRCGEPLDIATLVNGVSDWLYRSAAWCFRIAQAKRLKTHLERSLGNPRTYDPEELKQVSSNSITVMIDKVFDQEAATKLLIETLEGLNPPEGE